VYSKEHDCYVYANFDGKPTYQISKNTWFDMKAGTTIKMRCIPNDWDDNIVDFKLTWLNDVISEDDIKSAKASLSLS
jgi:hypothetical protein